MIQLSPEQKAELCLVVGSGTSPQRLVQRALVVLLASEGKTNGQRLGDLATLRWSGLDLQRQEISLITQKTHKRMVISISPPLLRHILSMNSSDLPDAPRASPRISGG